MKEGDDRGGNLPLSKAEQDRTDLNNEMAGREVGRIARFLPEDASPAALKKRSERNHERLSALMLLLRSDPEYAELHSSAMEKLRQYEQAAERALEDAIKRGDQNRIDEIRLYQVEVLGRARDRLTDEDNPPTKEEIREHLHAIEKAPPSVAQEVPRSDGSYLGPQETQTIGVPLPPIGR